MSGLVQHTCVDPQHCVPQQRTGLQAPSHGCPHVPSMQAGLSTGQTLSQLPQCCGSVFRLTHAPLQQTLPWLQDEQTPPDELLAWEELLAWVEDEVADAEEATEDELAVEMPVVLDATVVPVEANAPPVPDVASAPPVPDVLEAPPVPAWLEVLVVPVVVPGAPPLPTAVEAP